jgi:hypothetical protein
MRSAGSEIYVEINEKKSGLGQLTVGSLRKFIFPEIDEFNRRKLKIWKVNVKKNVIDANIKNNVTTDIIVRNLNGEEMEAQNQFIDYFQAEITENLLSEDFQAELESKKFILNNIHIFAIIPTFTGKYLPMFYFSLKQEICSYLNLIIYSIDKRNVEDLDLDEIKFTKKEKLGM